MKSIQEEIDRVYTVLGKHWNTLYPDCIRNIHAVNGHGYEPFIDNIEFLAPLRKSDHSILNIHYSTRTQKTDHVVKYNYSKGDYDRLRQSCRINWEDRLNPFRNDIENMWEYFKIKLGNIISQFVPKTKSFNAFKKDMWKCPLNSSLL